MHQYTGNRKQSANRKGRERTRQTQFQYQRVRLRRRRSGQCAKCVRDTDLRAAGDQRDQQHCTGDGDKTGKQRSVTAFDQWELQRQSVPVRLIKGGEHHKQSRHRPT